MIIIIVIIIIIIVVVVLVVVSIVIHNTLKFQLHHSMQMILFNMHNYTSRIL